MNKRFSIRPLIVGLGFMFLLAGCASDYYMVTDPHTRNVYYTDKVGDAGGGAVKLTDGRTGSTVTLQNSEVKTINSDEYKKGLATPMTPPESKPAAAPAAAPATAPAAAAPAAAPTSKPTAAPAAAPAAKPMAAPSPSPSGY